MRNALAVLVTVLFLSGCAHKKYTRQPPPPPASPPPPPAGAGAPRPAAPSAPAPTAVPGTAPATAPVPASGYSEAGIASWYGHPYHGRPAADGEIYRSEEHTSEL